MARPSARHKTKVNYKDWLRAKYLIHAIQHKAGLSNEQLSSRLGSPNGFITAALKYRYVVTDLDMRELEALAGEYSIPLRAELNGQIPITAPEVEQVMTDKRAPASRLSEGEQKEFERMISYLKKTGVEMRDISIEWVGYGNATSIYAALKPDKRATWERLDQLRSKFKGYYGISRYAQVALGEQPEEPVHKEPEPPEAPKSKDTFLAVKEDLEGIVTRLEALSAGLPTKAREAIEQSVTHWIKAAMEDLG